MPPHFDNDSMLLPSPACLFVVLSLPNTACSPVFIIITACSLHVQGIRGPQGLLGGLGDEWINRVELMKVGGVVAMFTFSKWVRKCVYTLVNIAS